MWPELAKFYAILVAILLLEAAILAPVVAFLALRWRQ